MKTSFGHTRTTTTISDDILLSPRDLSAIGIHFHINHLRRLWQRGDFPEPVHLSARKIAWKKSAVLHWIASKTGGV